MSDTSKTIFVADIPYLLYLRLGSDLFDDEVEKIALLIQEGDAVQGSLVQLRERVRRAHLFAVAKWNAELIAGVAGLKRPEASYRRRIQECADFDLSEDKFPAELGYVNVYAKHRGADYMGVRLSSELMSALLTTPAGRGGVFATTKKCGLRDGAFPALGFTFRATYQNEPGEDVYLLTKDARS